MTGKHSLGLGRFVVIEGIDGAGTTTQTTRLAAELTERGRTVVATREPSDGVVGELIRRILSRSVTIKGELNAQTLCLLFAADRVDHLQRVILPALRLGAIVLSDRYLLSSLAYQGIDVPIRWVAEVNRYAVTPDLTLFIEIDPLTASRRRAGRANPAELFEDDALQEQFARAYLEAISMREAAERIVRLTGHDSVEKITALAMEQICNIL